MSISDFNWSLDLSCCSTEANCTSCAVNWLVSSGSSGFWFLSCVVSSVRNVSKLPAIVPGSTPLELDDDEDELLFVVPDTTCEVVAGMVVVMMVCPECRVRLGYLDRRPRRAGGHSSDAVSGTAPLRRPAPR